MLAFLISYFVINSLFFILVDLNWSLLFDSSQESEERTHLYPANASFEGLTESPARIDPTLLQTSSDAHISGYNP